MTYHFCTIATPDYLPFVQTLHHSLKANGEACTLHVFLLSNKKPAPEAGIEWYLPEDISDNDEMHQLFEKYKDNNSLRWALKPFFLLHLLKKANQVIYLDNDIYFFSSYGFLFDELEKHSLLLTPHWSCFEPTPNFENFKTSFQTGLFNAGFIGATRQSLLTLSWWSRLCLNKMEKNVCEGFYDDQRYLDMAMIVDEKMGILRHLGCNVSSVNMHQNKRIKVQTEVLMNGKYPVVFIHFSAETVKHILNRNDALLLPYYQIYKEAFSMTGNEFNSFKHTSEQSSPIINMKRKLKIRTRIKQLLLLLYQKL